MAYHPARQRDPLLDTTTQAALEKRGREMLGVVLLVVAGLLAAALWSYNPDDPGWMTSSDAPAQNWLGRTGAGIAAPLHIIIGIGGWVLPAVLLAWGVRCVLHRGSERLVGRLIFAPIAVAVAAVYAATLVPGATWGHSFGLGGLFGDTVLGALLGILPLGLGVSLKLVSLMLGVVMVAIVLFSAGFTRPELARIGVFLLVGLLKVYEATLRLLGRAKTQAVAASAAGWDARKARAAERAVAASRARRDPTLTAEPSLTGAPRVRRADLLIDPVLDDPQAVPLVDDTTAVPAPKPGLLARVRARALKMPEPELVEPDPLTGEVPDPDEARVQSMITQAIRRRSDRVAGRSMMLPKQPAPAAVDGLPPEPPLVRAEPPLTAGYEVDEDALIDPVDVEGDAMPGAVSPVTLDRAQVFQRPPAATAAKAVVQHPVRKAVTPSRQARAEAQPALPLQPTQADVYEHPPLSLLESADTVERHHLSDEALEENARMLESVLDDYGVKGDIVSVRPGPVVTMYELEPAPGLKASRVIGLADDIARSMSALSARVSTVPGRSVIGIELPNAQREKVVLREILSGRDFGDSNLRLPLALGKDIGGEPVVANLAKMPHLLIAGTTGSGKSVAINTMILSLLYKLTPEECRLIMIDPKMLELSVYDGIPHLLSPVVTDPKKAVVALKWVVGEMEERYRKMSKMGVRNIEGYNGRVRDALSKGEMFTRTVQTGFDEETGDPVFETEESVPEALPYIVVIVDEMADLMMVAGKEIEACIQRLAQMARASGIHLIMATQRPSVDVITGTIKANFPTRISFQVTSKIDSRTILGEMGAEQLLGMGDMLYMAGGSRITRVHGPFVSDEEVEEVVNHLKSFGPAEYIGGVVDGPDEDKESDIDLVLGLGGNTDGEDALYDQAVAIVIKDRKCSTSYIQRKLAIGYNKAARLVEQMEEQGLVSPANHVGKREILVPEQA
ncbi:DNA translocase FtsK 4TM domain-containing protein [Tropicimonas sp. S265A]|uniref:DNA translocase FtsK n=1 Tax=Tropicimonas sp. S265A TaxID=3415134 RepID=UPI003C7DA6ED